LELDCSIAKFLSYKAYTYIIATTTHSVLKLYKSTNLRCS